MPPNHGAATVHQLTLCCCGCPRTNQARGLGENETGDNHYAAMHAAMRGHGSAVHAASILKARAVETGSTLVAAPPDGVTVVLQMPRGNLEAVHPRSLVLPAVAAAVQVTIVSPLQSPSDLRNP